MQWYCAPWASNSESGIDTEQHSGLKKKRKDGSQSSWGLWNSHIIQFLVKKSMKPTEIHRTPSAPFGDACLSCSLFKCCSEFKNGHEMVSNLESSHLQPTTFTQTKHEKHWTHDYVEHLDYDTWNCRRFGCQCWKHGNNNPYSLEIQQCWCNAKKKKISRDSSIIAYMGWEVLNHPHIVQTHHFVVFISFGPLRDIWKALRLWMMNTALALIPFQRFLRRWHQGAGTLIRQAC